MTVGIYCTRHTDYFANFHFAEKRVSSVNKSNFLKILLATALCACFLTGCSLPAVLFSRSSPASSEPDNTVSTRESPDLYFLPDELQQLYANAVDVSSGLYGMGDSLMYLWDYEEITDIDETYALYDADYTAFSEKIHLIFTDDCLADTDYAIKFIDHEGSVAVDRYLSNDMVENTTIQVQEAFPDTYRPVHSTEDEVEFTLISHYDRNGWNDTDDPIDVYTIEYPIRMVRTDSGWRIDEFHTTMFG